jgi:hypothetical protein
MERLNVVWHQAHPMPKPATLDLRVAWHQEHSRVCACREMPASIRDEIERRRHTG